MQTILVVNGPNLNLLGTREPEIYGHMTLQDLEKELVGLARDLQVELRFFQSNSEGAIIDYLQKEGPDASGVILNPGAFTHYSYAIRDAVASAGVRTVEVHLSNIYGREEFRRKSVIAPVCTGQISGMGVKGYLAALRFLVETFGDQ